MSKAIRSAANNAPLLCEAAVAVCFTQEPHKAGGRRHGYVPTRFIQCQIVRASKDLERGIPTTV